MTGDDVLVTTNSARSALDSACDALDNAVRALPHIPNDDVMASPGLVALLLRVVVARRHLAGIESLITGPDTAPANDTRWV